MLLFIALFGYQLRDSHCLIRFSFLLTLAALIRFKPNRHNTLMQVETARELVSDGSLVTINEASELIAHRVDL